MIKVICIPGSYLAVFAVVRPTFGTELWKYRQEVHQHTTTLTDWHQVSVYLMFCIARPPWFVAGLLPGEGKAFRSCPEHELISINAILGKTCTTNRHCSDSCRCFGVSQKACVTSGIKENGDLRYWTLSSSFRYWQYILLWCVRVLAAGDGAERRGYSIGFIRVRV